MKKMIIVLVITIVIISLVWFIPILIDNIDNKQFNPASSKIPNYVYVSQLDTNPKTATIEIDYVYTPGDKDGIAKYSDYVIIGKIESTENPYFNIDKNSTTTNGMLKVKKVFKGNLQEGQTIPFEINYGVISLSEFEETLKYKSRWNLEGMSFEERVSKYGLDKLSQEEKDSRYVFDGGDSKIPLIQPNKLYLMYINNRDNTYIIGRDIYHLREIDTNGIIIDYADARVKDNKNGQYISIREAISSQLVGPNTFIEFIENMKNKFMNHVFYAFFNNN